ncbi:hypothetical protein GCM10027610_098760 [Dactylosporangium cerinum]
MVPVVPVAAVPVAAVPVVAVPVVAVPVVAVPVVAVPAPAVAVPVSAATVSAVTVPVLVAVPSVPAAVSSGVWSRANCRAAVPCRPSSSCGMRCPGVASFVWSSRAACAAGWRSAVCASTRPGCERTSAPAALAAP